MDNVIESKGNIAIIGFSKKVPIKNKFLAFIAGCMLTHKGFNIAAGNTTGTFVYAFIGAKLFQGRTLAIIQPHNQLTKNHFIDQTLIVKGARTKHEYIACCSSAALVIGGGQQSLFLIEEFLKRGKPVIAVRDTLGISRTEVQAYGITTLGLVHAIKWLTLQFNNTEI